MKNFCATLFLLMLFGTSTLFAQSAQVWTSEKAEVWFEKKDYLNGLMATPHPAIDKVQFAQQYHLNKPLWDKAFAYLKNTDLTTLATGRYAIDGDNVFALVSEGPSKDYDKTVFESHINYIDLQFVIHGEENMGKAKLTDLKLDKPYNDKNDIMFYVGDGEIHTVTQNSFLLFFPSDGHRPNITPGGNKVVKKVVIKIRVAAAAQETKPKPTGTIEFIGDELSRVINKDAKVDIIAEGFQFTEGPLWLEKEKMLLLSDVPGNTIYKWTEEKGKEVYVQPAGYTDSTKRGGFMGPNGLLLSPEGKLWICQHGDRRIAAMDAPLLQPKANFVTVAGNYEGKRLNSPNDLVLSKAGDLYFTDPAYGFEKGPRDPKREITFQGVYKMDKGGKLTLLLDSLEAPNGIGIMPDGKTLLVANSDPKKRRWYAYEMNSKGELKNGKIFYDASDETAPGLCDGFKIDSQGNVFASGPGGIWIFNRTGKLIGKIKLEGVTAANCALTQDGKTLYITAVQYLLRVKMR